MKAKKTTRKSTSTGRNRAKDLTARGHSVKGGRTSTLNIEAKVASAVETIASDSTKDLKDLK
jgi:hypothetical protein